jgi:hypothetical protein
MSKNARQAVEVLSDYQNAAVDLLDLALEEATKEDKSLFDSFGFLFGQSLEALRFDIESGYKAASDLADCTRKRLVAASKGALAAVARTPRRLNGSRFRQATICPRLTRRCA